MGETPPPQKKKENYTFWPTEKETEPKKIKREKIPAVHTSPQVIQYFKKKEEEKTEGTRKS